MSLLVRTTSKAVGLYLWRRNAVLSILCGTATYAALLTGLPVR